MSKIFLSVLNMSLTASYVILFVILIRLLLKKSPRFISYTLWGVAAFRLIIPFSFESIFSLMPRNANAVPIPHDTIYQQSPRINSGIEVVNSFVSQSLPAPTVGASVNPLQIYTEIAAWIWVIGIIALLVYSLVSILILERQLKNAQLMEQNIFESKNLKTPFVLGLIRPKIYLPVGLNATERSYILLHEQAHIQRKDHIIKILAFLVLSIHWFNPLVWIAFVLMSTDMELSCDERVLKEMDEGIKKPYANSLLSLATGRHILNGSPLAFGEGNVRGRIKNVLNYKKPRFWVVIASTIILIGAGIALLSNPAGSGQDLSMLNIKNLANLSYQRDELVVSRAPGKKEGFNVSARAIAEYLDSVKWAEKKIDSSLELSVTLQIEWNEDQELRFYESEPLLAMVRMNEQFRYYTIGRNDYETILSIIEMSSKPQSMLNGSVEELWKSRTKYIGDNSAVGKIISLLPVPGDVKYDHFELHTSVQPYDIEIVYYTSSEILKKYDTEEAVKSNTFRKNALILLALVDNANGVRATLTDGKREVGFINAREWADYTVGVDVRNYAESPEKLQELINFYLTSIGSNVTEQTIIKPTTPELSLEQIVGVDMVQLDYASDDIVIFHDYFGLFVYDLNSQKIIRRLDLKPLDCHQTQGDNYCDVSVSMDGDIVQLHPLSSENMYVYTVSDNILKKTAYKQMENPFRSEFVPIEEVINSTRLGNHGHHAVLFDTEEYGYLHSEDGTIGTLSYVRGDMKYILFENK